VTALDQIDKSPYRGKIYSIPKTIDGQHAPRVPSAGLARYTGLMLFDLT